MELIETIRPSIIKVIGVGGGGSNAVNHMFKEGINGVDFVVCNTDAQALEMCSVVNKLQLGKNSTDGLGAGNNPETGKKAALESIDEIKDLLQNNTKMVFITAGMGGGTGTGAAPIIASVAKELDILTIGIVTIPFSWEGRKRKIHAEEGIKELRRNVDSLIIICNDKLRELHGDLSLSESFSKADSVLTTAAKGIAEIITITGYVNVDFEDVKTVMKDSGVAIMGTGTATGEKRAIKATELALSSPLLNDNNIAGAKNILLYISSGKEEIKMDELTEITEHIKEETGNDTNIIWGSYLDKVLENQISVTIVAAGFDDYQSEIFPTKEYVKSTQRTENIETLPNKLYNSLDKNLDIANKNDDNNANSDNFIQTESEIKKPIVYNLYGEACKKEDFKINTESSGDEKTSLTSQEISVSLFEKNHTQSKPEIQIHSDHQKQNSEERRLKLREISQKVKTPSGLEEISNSPAYLRKNVEINNDINDNSNTLTVGSLTKTPNGVRISSENSYLFDNVD